MVKKSDNKYAPTQHRIKKRTSIGREIYPVPTTNIRDLTGKNIEDKEGNYGYTYSFTRLTIIRSTIMSYIITQAQEDVIESVDDIDLMIDEDEESVYTFKSYEEAAAYLMCHGIKELSGGFPFNIRIERLQ